MKKFNELEADVLFWAARKGILVNSDTKTQLCKTMEELGETMGAVLKGNQPEIIDGIGDTIVTLIIAAHLAGVDFCFCLNEANDIIQKRNGKMINGVFVKETQ